jgi:hypothetical protein
VIISGTGFAPNRQVDVALQGSPLDRVTVVADAHGAFNVGLVLFAGTPQGPRIVTAHTHDVSSTISAQGPLLISLGSVDLPTLVTRH